MSKSNYTYFSNATIFPSSIIILILVGIFLRIQEMASPITGDLAGMLFMHFPNSWDSLLLNYQDTNQRTLYILLAKLSMTIFGENEFALRLPALLAGTLSLPLAYKVGVLTTGSRLGALIGTLLLTFSFPHLIHIREAKGYALTVFLALLLVYIVYKILDGKPLKIWGVLFFLTGLGMILIVPTNVHFLVGLGVFYTAIIIRYKKVPLSVTGAIKLVWPLALLFGMIMGYFLYIFQDLQRAIAGNKNCYKLFGISNDISFDFGRFTEILFTLISPSSAWLYIFLIFSLVRLYKTRELLLFSSLIIFPIAITILSELMGPPRVYIYWLPFFLILIGFGLAEFLVWVKSISSNVLSTFTGIIILTIIYFYPQTTYSESLFNSYDFSFTGLKLSHPPQQDTTLKDAQAAKNFIKKNTSQNDLLVVPFADRVLGYYLGEHIALNMLNILQNGRLDNIFFLGSSKVAPHQIPNVGVEGDIDLLKNHSFKLVETFGKLKLYNLNFSIKKLVPFGKDRDYENHLIFSHDKKTQLSNVKQPRIAGAEALSFIQSGDEGRAMSKNFKMIANKKQGTFILVNFATGHGHLSETQLLFPKGKVPIGDNYWNSFNGIFLSKKLKYVWKRHDPYSNCLIQQDLTREEENEFAWQIKFIIFPITGEKVFFTEGFRTREPATYFDGFQSFLLETKNPSE